jgi:hypothetical protein
VRGGKGGVVRKGGLRRGAMLGFEGWVGFGTLVLVCSRERARSGSIVVW